MREITLKYLINENLHVVAYIEGCNKPLEQEQLLEYLRLLEEYDLLKTLTNESDVIQMKDMIARREKRIGL